MFHYFVLFHFRIKRFYNTGSQKCTGLKIGSVFIRFSLGDLGNERVIKHIQYQVKWVKRGLID